MTALEVVRAVLAGATAGVVSPINPLLSPEHIASILRDGRARVVVTLAPFPKTDLAQKVAAAVALAPNVETVLQVDLARYLAPPLSWIAPLIRPRLRPGHRARILDLAAAMAAEKSAAWHTWPTQPQASDSLAPTGRGKEEPLGDGRVRGGWRIPTAPHPPTRKCGRAPPSPRWGRGQARRAR